MTALDYLPSFRRDVEDLWLYIAQDNLAAADRLLEALYDRCLILRDFPQVGQTRPDLGAGCRQLVEGNYPILYRYRPGHVELIRALDARRKITPDMITV